MKKLKSVLITCLVLITCFICIAAINQYINAERGLPVVFNGEETGYISLLREDRHYVPMRDIFEKMGAVTFVRERDGKILALSRDGDMISHVVEENVITINGQEKVFNDMSFTENETVYISVDVIASVLYTDEISCDGKELIMRKEFENNEYHKLVKDILDLSKDENFYPEKFQRYIEFHTNCPEYSAKDVVFRVNLGLDYPFYENITTIEKPHDLLVLVNKYNKLPEGFAQTNLVEMKKEHTASDGKEYLLLDTAYEAYTQMADAAKKDGLSMYVVSAYRTESYQNSLYNRKVSTSGKVHADNFSARAGHSEHQTGLAVDINSTSGTFEYTAEFRWLNQHAHEYGFILRYPKGKEWITGYSYEPWHYRYVGVDVATIIHDEDITYEEYYAKYIKINEFK